MTLTNGGYIIVNVNNKSPTKVREEIDKYMTEQVELIGTTEILGKEIKFYNSWENPLFLAKDVAEWIEHSNASKMIEDCDLDESETVKRIIEITYSYGNGFRTRKQEALFLTEDGLYEVLMQSRKPIAKQLKKKIKTHLKQMRQTGGTVEIGREEEFIYTMFPNLSESVKQAMVLDLQRINREQQEEIERQRNENKKLKGQLDTLVEDLTTFDQFNRVMNACVRSISHNTNINNGEVWNTFYAFLNKAHGININSRLTHKLNKIDEEYFNRTGKHYKESTLKSKASKLSTIRPDEYAMVLQVMKAFALDNDVDIEKVVRLELQQQENKE